MILLSQIRLSFFINGLKPMIGIILFTTFFQVFFTPGASVLWEFWIFKVSIEGLQQALIIFIRFVLIIFFSTLLTLTTTPLSLADGIEFLPALPAQIPFTAGLDAVVQLLGFR